jgi:hypothetical protein
MLFRVFPKNGFVVMDEFCQAFTKPVYTKLRETPNGKKPFYFSREACALFFECEDWTKIRNLYVYDDCVLVVNFTHHNRELLLGAEMLFLL